jgi:hypothetical protein
VKACEDGGAAAERAIALLRVRPEEDGAGTRQSRLERSAAELSAEDTDRLEARAYAEAMDFMERLGARGSALAISRALERRLEER